MKHIIEFNYETTKKRGLISKDTRQENFVMALEEEVSEFIDAALHEKGDYDTELADIILVCLNIAKHYGIDIESQMVRNIAKNMYR